MGVSSSGKYCLLLYKSNCFTISFMDLNVALKKTTPKEKMWNSPSLLLPNLKRGVLNTKTHQTSITKRPCSAL